MPQPSLPDAQVLVASSALSLVVVAGKERIREKGNGLGFAGEAAAKWFCFTARIFLAVDFLSCGSCALVPS